MAHSPLWLIAYDIAEPSRLRDVAQTLEDHGRRLQQSVFLCDRETTDLNSLRPRLLGLIDPDEDRLAVLPICGSCRDALEQYGVEMTLPGTAEAVVV
jgi:CRISPR-associated protein Cas2